MAYYEWEHVRVHTHEHTYEHTYKMKGLSCWLGPHLLTVGIGGGLGGLSPDWK